MENIGKSEINPDVHRGFDFNWMFKEYLKKYTLPLKILKLNNVNQIKIDTNILEKQLLDFVHDKVYKNKTTGKYYEGSIVNYVERKSDDPLLTFKGEVIYSKTYKIENINILDTDYVVHPSITRQFAKNAIRRIRDYYFKKTTNTDPGKIKAFNI
jgi:hypothetical protein